MKSVLIIFTSGNMQRGKSRRRALRNLKIHLGEQTMSYVTQCSYKLFAANNHFLCNCKTSVKQ